MVSTLRVLPLLFCFVLFALLPFDARSEGSVVCGSGYPSVAAYEDTLKRFARKIGLDRIRAFVGTVSSIVETGFAPPCYLKKNEARARGWRPGKDLCAVDTGLAIGSYPFQNREGLLPRDYEGSYRIADLDYACGKRNARRLVYVEGRPGEWLMWVTMDHYASYIMVPRP